MKKIIRMVLIVILCFSIHFAFRKYYFTDLIRYFDSLLHNYSLGYIISYIITGFPFFISALFLHKFKDFFFSFGLNKGFFKAFIWAFIFTIPMLVGFALVFHFNTGLKANVIIIGAIAAAFFEELYFRAFFFGYLFRFSKIGFIPSILIPSVIFASLHLYQSFDLMTMIGIFLTTFLGSLLFAWVFIEWEYNLWVPIFLHFLMNLYWLLFSAGETALGGLYSNIFRVLTIIFIIVGTILYKKKNNTKLLINKNNLWLQKEENV